MNFQNKKILLFFVALVCVGVFLLLMFAFGKIHKNQGGQYADLLVSGGLFPVRRVVDGDTVIVGARGHDITLRLIGIDTPEVVDPRKPVQCFGPEASAKAKELLSGFNVEVEKDPHKGDYDKYGRVLAYIRLRSGENPAFPNGLFYNEFMITEGYAREYTYFKEPYAYQAEFKAAEKNAKKDTRGLWRVCSP